MRLKITHRTEYRYDAPVHYAVQRLRLVPQDSAVQQVGNWTLLLDGAVEELAYADHLDNQTRLIRVEGGAREISIEATGEVETFDKAGISGPHRGFAPLWLYRGETLLTEPGEGITKLAAEIGPDAGDVQCLHSLMELIGQRVRYIPGATDSGTLAEAALAQGAGVCQDHSHIFISAARRLGYPARYVSGYLMMDGVADQVASHAWAEAYVDDLGWVAFDVSNGISADERYVRLAIGRDYREAMPISGILLGNVDEQLAVHITVEQ